MTIERVAPGPVVAELKMSDDTTSRFCDWIVEQICLQAIERHNACGGRIGTQLAMHDLYKMVCYQTCAGDWAVYSANVRNFLFDDPFGDRYPAWVASHEEFVTCFVRHVPGGTTATSNDELARAFLEALCASLRRVLHLPIHPTSHP